MLNYGDDYEYDSYKPFADDSDSKGGIPDFVIKVLRIFGLG